MERDCEPSHSGPHNADVSLDSSGFQRRVCSQFAEDDFAFRNHGRVAVCADDFSQRRLKRSSYPGVFQRSPNFMLQIVVEPVPSRRVVLVPGSPDGILRSIQGRSASNRFSVLVELDAEDGQLHHDIGTPPPTADEGDIENNDTASLVGQHPSWEGPRTGVGSVIGEDVIPEGEEVHIPSKPVEYVRVQRFIRQVWSL